MKLYACPGTCSLAPHIALLELNVEYEFCSLNLRDKASFPPEFLELNPLGQVPTLVTDDGEVITEASAILMYLFGEFGHLDVPVYQNVRHLSFIATELHKNFYPQFFAKQILGPDDPSLEKLVDHFKSKHESRWAYVDALLPELEALEGANMGPADPYLYTVCRWWIMLGRDFAPYKFIQSFLKSMEARASVQKALEIEGLEPVGGA